MKTSCVCLLAGALVAFVGCDSKSTPGGPGAKNTTTPGGNPSKHAPTNTGSATGTTTTGTATGHNAGNTTSTDKPLIGQKEETFTLSVPTLSTHIKQGETKTVSISAKKGKNFDEDVTLKFGDLPKGVTVDPASPAIKHGDTKADVTVHAADDAAVGDFTVKVTGHPSKGADATDEMKITVSKK